MTQIKTDWTIGNFSVALAVESTPVLLAALAPLGVKWIGQRQSEVDKVLGGFETVSGKPKRKANWKRTDSAYSVELGNKLKAVFAQLKLDDEITLEPEVTVSEYIPGDGADYKFSFEKEVIGERESLPESEWVAWLKGLGVGEDEAHDDAGEYSAKLLSAVRDRKRAKEAEMKAAMKQGL